LKVSFANFEKKKRIIRFVKHIGNDVCLKLSKLTDDFYLVSGWKHKKLKLSVSDQTLFKL